jgi:DNA-binding CsgD family transcriptional regulator
MTLASSPDKHKSCDTRSSIAYANEDLDASELQNDWPDGFPRLLHRYSPEYVEGECSRRSGCTIPHSPGPIGGLLRWQLAELEDVFEALRLVDQERRKDREVWQSFEKLTDRELEVLQAMADGLSDREISERFHVGSATVRTHVTSILAKLGAASRLRPDR